MTQTSLAAEQPGILSRNITLEIASPAVHEIREETIDWVGADACTDVGSHYIFHAQAPLKFK
jgi:hypothetical protein